MLNSHNDDKYLRYIESKEQHEESYDKKMLKSVFKVLG